MNKELFKELIEILYQKAVNRKNIVTNERDLYLYDIRDYLNEGIKINDKKIDEIYLSDLIYKKTKLAYIDNYNDSIIVVSKVIYYRKLLSNKK